MCQLCVHWRADSDGFDRTKSKTSSSTIMLGHTPVAKLRALHSSWNFLPYHIRHTVLIWPRLTFSYFLCWRNISKEITMKPKQKLRRMFALGADPRHQNSSLMECENLYNAGASVLNAMVTMLKNDSSSDRWDSQLSFDV